MQLERRATTRVARFTTPSRRWPSTVVHISGLALVVVAPGLLISAIVELIADGDGAFSLFFCAALFAALGGGMYRGSRLGDLAPRTIFASVAWSWLLVSVLGALPFILARTFERDGISRWVEVADAIFESVSGYTCTGSTVLTTLPDLGESDPVVGKGVLFYRQLTQWYGGMGFVQLVITVLPVLGSRALGFMGAEAPGPTSERLSARAADTARILWYVYIGATLLIAAGFALVGMSIFDAVAHGATTAATGGFSLYNDSLGEYDSVPIEVVAQIGMLIGGANFALHWLFISKDRGIYRRDHEFRAYFAMIFVSTVVVVSMLLIGHEVDGFWNALRSGSFNVVSLATSTGFGNAQGAGSPGDFVRWSSSPLMILLLLMVVGGMSGSTAGGMKVVRLRVLAARAHRLVVVARQPRAIVPLKLNHAVVPDKVVHQIGIFVMANLAFMTAGLLAVTFLGGEIEESLSAVIGSLSNMGPGFGEAGPTNTFQAAFPTPARMVLAFLMLAGRLELFAVLLMFASPGRVIKDVLPRRRAF